MWGDGRLWEPALSLPGLGPVSSVVILLLLALHGSTQSVGEIISNVF